jgi:hypothetical protein
MPSEGQQHVYGAQHPPNIKLIKELATSSSASNPSSSLSSTSNATTSSSHQATANSFLDFEKKTFDVWDLDDDYDVDNEFTFPISITDSEEVAKKIIKNHKESQEKSQQEINKQSSSSNLFSPNQSKNKSFSNGPGKALRQDNSTPTISTYSYESYKKYINNTNNKLSNESKKYRIVRINT